jgi:hypothetical protein
MRRLPAVLVALTAAAAFAMLASASAAVTRTLGIDEGQAVTIRGTDCPSGQPSASLDGQRVDLAVQGGAKGKSFTATIPASVSLGSQTLRVGCEAGFSRSAQPHVTEATEAATDRMTFGTGGLSDLALGAWLFSGVAVLVASVGITSRRRRS